MYRQSAFPERTDSKNEMTFIEAWLSYTFGWEEFSPMFAVERAQRVPAQPPPPQGAPRHVEICSSVSAKNKKLQVTFL